jgi:hypothetical protein
MLALPVAATLPLEGAGMFWYWLWLALTGCIMITNHITMARGDKRPRAMWDAIVANGALLAWRSSH